MEINSRKLNYLEKAKSQLNKLEKQFEDSFGQLNENEFIEISLDVIEELGTIREFTSNFVGYLLLFPTFERIFNPQYYSPISKKKLKHYYKSLNIFINTEIRSLEHDTTVANLAKINKFPIAEYELDIANESLSNLERTSREELFYHGKKDFHKTQNFNNSGEYNKVVGQIISDLKANPKGTNNFLTLVDKLQNIIYNLNVQQSKLKLELKELTANLNGSTYEFPPQNSEEPTIFVIPLKNKLALDIHNFFNPYYDAQKKFIKDESYLRAPLGKRALELKFLDSPKLVKMKSYSLCLHEAILEVEKINVDIYELFHENYSKLFAWFEKWKKDYISNKGSILEKSLLNIPPLSVYERINPNSINFYNKKKKKSIS